MINNYFSSSLMPVSFFTEMLCIFLLEIFLRSALVCTKIFLLSILIQERKLSLSDKIRIKSDSLAFSRALPMPIFSVSDKAPLIPAVSFKITGNPQNPLMTSKTSLVVPASLVTIATFFSINS